MSPHDHHEFHEEAALGSIYDARLIKRLLVFLKPYRVHLVFSLVVLLAVTGFELVLPEFTRRAIDNYITVSGRKAVPGRPVAGALGLAGDTVLVDVSRLSSDDKYLMAGWQKQGLVDGTPYYYFDLKDFTKPEEILPLMAAHPGLFSRYGSVVLIKHSDLGRLSPGEISRLRARDFAGIKRIGLQFLVLIVLGFALNFFQTFLVLLVGQRFMHDLRRKVFARLQVLDMQYFDRNPVGRLVTRATNDVDAVNEAFTSVFLALLRDILLTLAILGMLFCLQLETGPGGDGPAALHRAVDGVLPDPGPRHLPPDPGPAGPAQRHPAGEHLRGPGDPDLPPPVREHPTIQTGQPGLFPGLHAGGAGDVLLPAAGGGDLRDRPGPDHLLRRRPGDTAEHLAGSAGGLHHLFADVLPPHPGADRKLHRAAVGHGQLRAHLPAAGRAGDHTGHAPVLRNRSGRKGRIEFKDVCFEYLPGEPVLKNITFAVAPGEKVALVGSTGSGKTTIINLISRLYDVTSGQILLDGTDIRELVLSDLRSSLGVVMQDVFLFSGDIKGNIRLNKELSDEKVREIARQVHADTFIERLPQKYDQEVKERGVTLSSGERQLLSFARALAFDPPVLVLDEATANIDSATEKLIQDALDILMRGRTSIVIAHRLSTIKHVDRIYVLHKGQIKEVGTHQELLQKRGVYYNLYQLQHGKEAE